LWRGQWRGQLLFFTGGFQTTKTTTRRRRRMMKMRMWRGGRGWSG
jgi:hypothetical protein